MYHQKFPYQNTNMQNAQFYNQNSRHPIRQNSNEYNNSRGDRSYKRNYNNPHWKNRPSNYQGKGTNIRHPQNDGKQEQLTESENNTLNNGLYICPGCSCQYNCYIRNGKYVGKVPLILNCKHTVCQECIIKSYRVDNVLCSVCNNPSMITQKSWQENPQDTFLPNFFVFGYILWTKSQNIDNFNIALVPVKPLSDAQECASVSETICCFLSCNKPATLHCPECNDVYCSVCCTTVHKSAKSLWTHNQVPISTTQFSVLLKCPEHTNMDVEFFCLSCNCGACCYCLIEKHTGHEKEHLSKLNDEETQKLLKYKEKSIDTLKRLLVVKKKLTNVNSFNKSNLLKKINEYFIGLYSKLQFVEKNLLKMSDNFQNGGINKNLEKISMQVEKSIATLRKILVACENAESQKVNLKEILQNLEQHQNMPCYLLCGKNVEEPVSFFVDSVLDNIEDYFRIAESDFTQFTLVTEDQLPIDYEDVDKECESEIDTSLMKALQSDLMLIEASHMIIPQKKKTNNEPTLGIQTERVDVTHIESVECFYVQQRRMQYKLLQMNRDIDNSARMSPRINHSMLTINDLCLAYYETKKEKFWSRGRVMEIKNGENGPLYEIFFIDYGNTQTINISNLREITPGLAQRKSFAIQCELYNPAGVTWGKHAHVHMAKLINGKEVYMLVKKIDSGIHVVDLMVMSSDRGLTSLIDILIYAVSDSLSICSDSNSTSSEFHDITLKQENVYMCDYKIYSNSVKFEKKQSYDITIANIVDPHNIFIHIAKYGDVLKQLITSMKLHYRKQKSNSFMPIEGSFVIVEHKDTIRGNFHRALVKKVNITSDQVSVYCIDWGINITVPFKKIRMLKENFTKLESQAIIIKLTHVEPYQRTHVWSEQAAHFLQKYFNSKQILKMVVHATDPLEVALFEKCTNVDLCINALLVQEKMADSTGRVSQIVEWPHGDCIPTNIQDEDSFVSSLLKKANENSDSDSTDADANNVVKQRIDVVKFVNPDLFYIKFICTESSEEDLHRELQIHYFKKHDTRENWDIDDLCVALYGNSYFRGKILNIKDDKYKINLYDKALDIELTNDKIFEYDKYFAKYPNVIFKAHFANIGPAGGDKWSMASIEAVQKIFDTYQDILASRVAADPSRKSMPLKIWYTKVKIRGALEASVVKYKCINDLLVKLGYAYKKPADIHSKEAIIEEINNEVESTTEQNKGTESGREKSKRWIDLVEEEERKVDPGNDSPYHIREAEIVDWKAPFEIKEREFYAWVTCAETEGILYIRAENLQEVYKDLEKNIKEYFDNNTELNTVNHDWQPGQLCSIESKGFWYRGKIHKVNSPNEIIAIMIDFGSDHHITPQNLYREILYPEIPAFASQIKLDRVYAKSGSWLTSDYETLLNIVPEYVKIVIKGPLNVNIPLAEVYSSDDASVNQLLVEKCPNLTRTDVDEGANSDDATVVIEEEYIECSSDNELTSDVPDPIALSLFQTPVDTTSFSYKNESIPQNEKTPVTVAAVMSYNKIVIKKQKESLDEDLTEFFSGIQVYCESQPTIKDIKLGMPCICPYSGDGLWYRAKIHNINGLDCGRVIVFFVDFGNIQSVTIDKIKLMKPEWFNFPTSCHIATLNFELKSENYSEYVYEHIQKLFGLDKECEAVCQDPLKVNLYNENGDLTYQSLVESGLIQIN